MDLSTTFANTRCIAALTLKQINVWPQATGNAVPEKKEIRGNEQDETQSESWFEDMQKKTILTTVFESEGSEWQ